MLHLKRVEFTEFQDKISGLLIGLDNLSIFSLSEIRRGGEREPGVMLTALVGRCLELVFLRKKRKNVVCMFKVCAMMNFAFSHMTMSFRGHLEFNNSGEDRLALKIIS